MAKALVFFGNFNLSLRKQFLTLKVGCILTSEEKLLGLFIFIQDRHSILTYSKYICVKFPFENLNSGSCPPYPTNIYTYGVIIAPQIFILAE